MVRKFSLISLTNRRGIGGKRGFAPGWWSSLIYSSATSGSIRPSDPWSLGSLGLCQVFTRLCRLGRHQPGLTYFRERRREGTPARRLTHKQAVEIALTDPAVRRAVAAASAQNPLVMRRHRLYAESAQGLLGDLAVAGFPDLEKVGELRRRGVRYEAAVPVLLVAAEGQLPDALRGHRADALRQFR